MTYSQFRNAAWRRLSISTGDCGSTSIFSDHFVATPRVDAQLDISNEELPTHELAANLRRVFSGIVSGNVREDTAEHD